MIYLMNIFLFCLGSVFCAPQSNAFDEDLEFIHRTIQENHPGVYNSLDPNFSETLEENFNNAKQELSRARSDQEKAIVLQEFGRKFQDAHLWVWYDLKSVESPAVSPIGETRAFEIRELQNGVWWINIPTFRPCI